MGCPPAPAAAVVAVELAVVPFPPEPVAVLPASAPVPPEPAEVVEVVEVEVLDAPPEATVPSPSEDPQPRHSASAASEHSSHLPRISALD